MMVMVARIAMSPRRRAASGREASGEARSHEQPEREDDEPDLAWREADVGHAGARGEAEALGLGAGVADHERRGHGGGGQDRARPGSRRRRSPRRCRRRRSPRPSGRRRSPGTRRACEALPVARARAPSNMSKTPPNTSTRMPGGEPRLDGRRGSRRRTVTAKPIRVRAFGVRPSAAQASAIGVADAAHAVAQARRDRRSRCGAPGRAAVGEAEDRALAVGERLEGASAGAGRPSRGRAAGSRRGRPRGAGRGATTRAAATARRGR